MKKMLKGMALLLVLSGATLAVAMNPEFIPMWTVEANELLDKTGLSQPMPSGMSAKEKEVYREVLRQSLRTAFDTLNREYGITDEKSLALIDQTAASVYGTLFTRTRTQGELRALVSGAGPSQHHLQGWRPFPRDARDFNN